MTNVSAISSVRGMHDLLPRDTANWQYVEGKIREWIALYDYAEIRTPIVEQTPLFVRAIGEVTDIVEKEMYSFHDRLNGDALTLRPEGTASCIRAVLQHHLLHDGPRKLWYMGPMFRHERPQKGRTRQFHQFGVEAIGYRGPEVDVELVAMCARLWRILNIGEVRLEVNSLGQPDERMEYRSSLVAYLESRKSELDTDSQRRLGANPLRILDSKNPEMRNVIDEAPILQTYLGSESRKHFDEFLESVAAKGISFVHNPRLVRGLDYYNRTVFEWVSSSLGSQGTICAGGRYDGLVTQLGGRETPGCGFAMGLERVIALCIDEQGEAYRSDIDVFVASAPNVPPSHAIVLAEEIRDAGLKVAMNCAGGSFKAQFKRAAACGAKVALVLGENELTAGTVSMRLISGLDEVGQAAMTVVTRSEAANAAKMLLLPSLGGN